MDKRTPQTRDWAKGPRGYVIGSGWWCTHETDEVVNPNRKKLGTPLQREVAFFETWLTTIDRCCTPETIVVVDSAAPVKPAPELRDRTVWIELPFNARHSTDHIGHLSGWTRSVIASASYALTSEAAYYAYVEQDCLIKGPGVIEFCRDAMTKGLMFGSGDGTPQPLQQSVFLVDRARLASFVKNLADLRQSDKELSPEWKFVFASWRPFVIAANWGLMNSKYARDFAVRIGARFFYDTLPVGTGRGRPIPFDDTHYYFQHGTEDDIARHVQGAKT